jgi:hypothetical protein
VRLKPSLLCSLYNLTRAYRLQAPALYLLVCS